MAKSGAVWGIDIGNCALKALRCRRHEKDINRIVVEAFDFVEYSKILTQPEADREELVREAIGTFVSRNDLKGDRVAISVPGQSGLSRFIKLPPVEAKKIPDIVRYEARQQIPFALEDVVWDYQQLSGGSQEDDYALDPEVGIFAMKRDQVHRAIQPITDAGIEVDYIQLAPLAIYNYACFDRMNNLEDAEAFDPENPPKSLLVLSFGTETTDLVVTNGFRVWQRNIPIGGSHFTRALTKELRLTFTKAEHLKRNATKAEDPKALFQAMRPVFSDLVAEIQRSIGFFMNNNKNAKIGEIVALGNPMRLPGLQRYLSQNLEQKVLTLEEFPGLVGGSVTAAPQFQANHLSFAEAYGLCVQGLGLGQLRTNLLPDEIVTERLVKGKKPWAVAAAAVLMVGMTGNYFSHYSAFASADVTKPEMAKALSAAGSATSQARGFEGDHATLKTTFEDIDTIRKNLRSNDDGRLLWLELIKALDAVLPKDTRPMAQREQTAEDLRNREEVHVERFDCEFFPDVGVWHSEVKRGLEEAKGISSSVEETPVDEPADSELAADGDADALEEGAEDLSDELAEADAEAVDDLAGDALEEFDDEAGLEGEEEGPTGEGWIIQITGYHFHNSDINNPGEFNQDNEAGQFVRRTLIKQLREGTVTLPNSQGQPVELSMKDLGISYPVIVSSFRPVPVTYDPTASSPEEATKAWRDYQSAMEPGGREGLSGRVARPRAGKELEVKKPEHWKLRRYNFEVQFIWQPKPRGERENPPTEFEDDYSA
ncbi:MAG: pilus assembly protein PilM [Aeoliella sp.]